MSLGSKIRTGAMVSGAFSAHKISKAQEQAMLAGSMIRWDSIAAKPKSYDENGKAIKPKDYER